jgi:trans-aconitate methyltransferase
VGEIPLEQKEIYGSSFNEGGDTPEGFNWRDRATQELRFAKLLENLDTSNSPSICDFGCGTGDLHQFLNLKKIEHEFHGLDIVPEMIFLAKKKHTNAKFLLDADLGKIPDEEFDLVGKL